MSRFRISNPLLAICLSEMRSLLDIFAQTLRTLWAHKLRSFLTMFGIAWEVGWILPDSTMSD